MSSLNFFDDVKALNGTEVAENMSECPAIDNYERLHQHSIAKTSGYELCTVLTESFPRFQKHIATPVTSSRDQRPSKSRPTPPPRGTADCQDGNDATFVSIFQFSFTTPLANATQPLKIILNWSRRA